MSGLRGLAAKLFKRESIAKEFDPETDAPVDDDGSQNGGGDSGSESSEEDTKDTEHYVPVGKSKLRSKQPLALGPEYRGVRVSRAQIEQESEDDEEEEEEDDDDEDAEDDEDEDFDDPEDADLEADNIVDSEDEIDSDDAFGSDDEALKKKFTFRGSSKPRVAKKKEASADEDEEDDEDEEMDEDDAEEDDEDEDGSEEDDDEDDSDGSDDSGGSEEEEDDDTDGEDETTAKALEQARKLLAQDQQRVVSSLSASAKADADKGFAVRQQRRAFDALLNVRIRMQKALVSANSLSAADATAEPVDSSVADDAEAKTIQLLNTIHSIRQSFASGEAGESSSKRKRAEAAAADDDDDDVDTSVSCETLFGRMVEAEEAAVAKRRKVLDRWSQRVQRPGAGAAASSSGSLGRRSGGGEKLDLVTMLEGQLATPDRLIRRTQTPRSCAPAQMAKRVQEDPEIYDDADFYQLLLKELVDQRAADTSATGTDGAPTVRWATAAAKEAKTRKLVDRRASKGRKMRFNVHEKLQNFMAPEDRRQWEPEAIDRLFSTLFGQRLELREDDGAEEEGAHGEDQDDEGGVSLEEESLRLFRN